MSWAVALPDRQHLRQSLWAVPLVGAVVGGLLLARRPPAEGRVPAPGMVLHRVHRERSCPRCRRDGRTRRARRDDRRARRADGDRHVVATVHAAVVPGPPAEVGARLVHRHIRVLLFLLRHVGSGPVPNLGVTMAGLAVTVDLVLLLVYLDRFVHALRPVAVAAAMARSGLDVVAEIERGRASATRRRAARIPGCAEGAAVPVHAERSGAIQAIHVGGLSSSPPSATSCATCARRWGTSSSPGRAHGRPRPAPTEADVATGPGDGRARARADDRPGPGFRDPDHRRHRDPRAVARGQRPDHRHPDDQPHRGAACAASVRTTSVAAASGWSTRPVAPAAGPDPAAGTTTSSSGLRDPAVRRRSPQVCRRLRAMLADLEVDGACR